MPNGGTLTVTSELTDNLITIRVTDTGCGMSQEVIDRIFDPFFTTKGALGGGDSSGTGLGLSISQGIIMGHNGDLKVDSQPNSYTTFTVTLWDADTENVLGDVDTDATHDVWVFEDLTTPVVLSVGTEYAVVGWGHEGAVFNRFNGNTD